MKQIDSLTYFCLLRYYYKTLSWAAIEYTAIPPEGYQNHVKPEACRGFTWFWYPEGGTAVYSMVAYERVFFSHTYRVNYAVNYFCFNLAKLILLKLKK